MAVAQPLCVPYDVGQNAVAHAAAVRAAAARVVVFPELSLTGYELEAPALTAQDPRLIPLAEACAETGSVALAGAPVPGEAGRPHIAVLAVDGIGITVVYRKLWLGGAEAERFAPGDKPAVLDVDGWRLGLAVCKDVSVPQHQADTAAQGIDAYVAGTVMSADERALQDEPGQPDRGQPGDVGRGRELRGDDGRRLFRVCGLLRPLVAGRERGRPGRRGARRDRVRPARLSTPAPVTIDNPAATLRVRRWQ